MNSRGQRHNFLRGDKNRLGIPPNVQMEAGMPVPKWAEKLFDAAGSQLAEGDILHVPVTALPGPVMQFRVARIEMPGVIETGKPKRPPILVLISEMVIPVVDPDGTTPHVYRVGNVKDMAKVQQPQIPVETTDQLESEKPPEGIEVEN